MIDSLTDDTIATAARVVYDCSRFMRFDISINRQVCGIEFTPEELRRLYEIGELNRMVKL